MDALDIYNFHKSEISNLSNEIDDISKNFNKGKPEFKARLVFLELKNSIMFKQNLRRELVWHNMKTAREYLFNVEKNAEEKFLKLFAKS